MKFQGIIFSGLPGAGKSALVRELAGHYRWPVISAGDFWRKRYRDSIKGRQITFEEFWRGVSDADNLAMDRQIENLVADNPLIGEFRFVKHLQKYPFLLVFLTADLETRAKYKKETYEGKTVDEIKKILSDRETDELNVGLRLYGYDYRETAIYHIVLNSAMMSLGEEIDSIVGIVGSPNI